MMKRFMLFTMAIGLSGMIWASSAQAISLDFVLQHQTVIGTGPVSVDVVVSGLGDEIVSAFDLGVSFDGSLLSATGVIFSDFLGDGPFEVLQGSSISGGMVDFAALSLLGIPFTPDDSILAALQLDDPFTLVTLNFATLGIAGISDLEFDENLVIGRNAQELSPSFGTGSIEIISAAVPEPSTWLLFGTGLMGLACYRWRRQTLVS